MAHLALPAIPVIFARQLGLKPCFTPVKSPQSNGMSKAFVNTLKRDYVRLTPLPDAETVLGLIAGWFENDNENHPHSGLKMRSSREFIAAQTATARVSGETGARSRQTALDQIAKQMARAH